MVITHNISAENISRNLSFADSAKAKAAERLNTGYRVNRAADDSAGLTVSEGMRAQIRGLNQASTNIHDGISLTNTADGAIQEIHAILQRERELMVQAANDTYCDDDRQAMQDELIALNSELDRMFEQAEFNTIKIFQGKETLIDGPNVDVETTTKPDIEKKRESSKTTVIWISKEDIEQNGEPQDEIDNVTIVEKSYSSSYSETEKPLPNEEDPLHPLYQHTDVYECTTVTTTTERENSTTYEKMDANPQYTSLQDPGNMVGKNGYINVKNVEGDLALSCAMSQLGISIDGEYSQVDLYNSSIPKSTVVSDDGSVATTTFSIAKYGIELDQIIELTDGGKSYTISYALRNTDSNEHDIKVRLAFDVMNLDREHAASTQDGKAAMPYELENEDAVIPVSAQGVTDACFTQINDLYGVLDKSNVKMDKTGITHTGAGFWWEASANAGSAINLGSVKYGPIELKKVPYEMKVESKDNIIISEETTKTTTEKVYKPKYLDIQAGANAFQLVPIRTWNLSAENLKCRVPTELSAYNAQDSLVHLDRVIDKITSIRVYYGAMTNRMEHAYLNADNTAENLTSSESRIRDADLADEMVVYSKNAIVQQAGQSMLAQANRNAQGIVALLQ